jgi:glycosyltransferase involved in cell wall biosynthesis
VRIRFLIANAYGVGGTIRTTYNLAGELAKNHDVEIISVHKSHKAPVFTVPPGVRLRPLVDRSKPSLQADSAAVGRDRIRVLVKRGLRRLPSVLIHHGDYRYKRFRLESDLHLWRFLRSVDDGVLIGTRAGLNLALARLARPGVVAVGQEHLNFTTYRAGIKRAFRRLYPRLDAYATLTERDATAFRELLGPGANVVCMPNGISGAGRPRSTNTSRIVVAAGRLTPQKGFDRLIRAWTQVQEQHPDWELRIFGGGRLRGRLQRRIRELGIADSARLMGYTDRLPDELAKGSFYVMSSRFEGFPMVLLEAMAGGLPVVSFDCPNGPRDLISEGTDGFIVPNGDIEALAAAMVRMIELGDGRRREFGEAAFRKSEQYRIDAVAARWVRLFEELQEAKAYKPRRGLVRTVAPGPARRSG